MFTNSTLIQKLIVVFHSYRASYHNIREYYVCRLTSHFGAMSALRTIGDNGAVDHGKGDRRQQGDRAADDKTRGGGRRTRCGAIGQRRMA